MRITMIFCLGFASLLAVTAVRADGPGQSRTPSSQYAKAIQPWQFDFGNQSDAQDALTHQGYTVEHHENPDTSYYPNPPNPTLPQWVSCVGAYAGAFFHGGHGDSQGIAVEVYPRTARGHRLAQNRVTFYANNGYSGQVYLFEAWPDTTGWAVSLTRTAASSRCHLSNAVVDIETCCSTYSGAWNGARVEFVNDCNLDNASSFTNSSAIWGGMDGNVSGSDRWKYRTACWAFTHASSHCTKRERQTGGNYTTLAPCVKWTNTTPYQMIPADGMTVQLLFDTHMDQSSDPCLIWRADGGIFTLDSATWDSDTLLTVRVNPIDNAYGTGTLVAEQQGAYSADCSYLHLDGDASGGASDWSIALKHDNLPAATLEGVDWKDGVFTWSVSSEADTRGYRVEGRTPPGDWQAVGGLQPPGVGRRSLSVGSAYTEYRVVEVETHGHEIIGNTVSTAPRSALPTYPERTLAELQAALRDRAARGPEHEASTRFNGEKIVVFTPLAWTSDIQYLMGYLAGWYGITYQMETVEQFGTPENRLYGIKNRISQLYGQGYRYVLLVGDASDWQYFDGPYTAEYWPNAYWESIRQGYFTAGYPHGGDPSLNVIPTVMVKDQLPREQGVAYYQPYYQLSDLLSYGDVDADGLPDLAVGRWPFTTEQEVAAACYKTLEYIDHGGWGYDQPYTVNVFLGDVNHYEGGEAQHVTAVANAIKSHFSTGTTFRSQAQS